MKGESLTNTLSLLDPDFIEKNLSEKPIDQYKRDIKQVAADIPRIKKFSLHKNASTQEYTEKQMSEILVNLDGKNLDEKKETFAKKIIESITKDPLMQEYLYSEFHQSGIQRISAAMLTEPPLKSIGQHATPMYNAIDVTTIDERNLKILSQTIFSDQILSPEDMSKFPHPEIAAPLFVCNVELDIKLVNNENDPNTKKISIAPSLEIYIVPGGEALFERVYQGFIDKFEQKTLELESIEAEKIALIKDKSYEKKPLSSSDEEEAESLNASTSDLEIDDFVNIDIKKTEKKPISSSDSDNENFEIIESPPLKRQKGINFFASLNSKKEEKKESTVDKLSSFFSKKKN